ncbi:hypothetical protein KAF44_19115 [Cupriavidus necator]|nr:hypothetical protein KAF44_19115 [Cupriavidus necator]
MKIKEGFNLLATAPDGVARLRELILTLAVQGKLVPQDSNDEPASFLLKQIAKEKHHSEPVSKGKRKTSASLLASQSEKPPLPRGWEWSSLAEIGVIGPRNNADDDLPVSFVQMSSIPTALVSPHGVEERPWSAIKTGFTHFAEGDVGVAKITPCFENGKSTVFRNLTNGIGAGTTELHVVRPLGGILPDYVLIFLKTPEFLLNGEKVMTGSAGQKRLPRDYFENKRFPLPPRAEQARIVAKVQELMRLSDELESRGSLEAEQHARLTTTLFEALAASESAHALAENWSRLAANIDLLLDRPEAVDALEKAIGQLAVRGLIVSQDPDDEPANELLRQIRVEKDNLIAAGVLKRDKPLPPIQVDDEPFPCRQDGRGPDSRRLVNLDEASRSTDLGTIQSFSIPVYIP